MGSWLVIGGTRFVGHHITAAALRAGHRVTLLHRGQTPCDNKGAEEVFADRDGGLLALDGRTWDAVIDVCGYLPRTVEDLSRRLEGRVGHFTFISTLSVYPPRPVEGPLIREGDNVLPWTGPDTEAIDEHTYGPLKVRCEEAVRAHHPGALVVRPGYIVGPRDSGRRFSFWVRRVARGGPLLVPDNLGAPMQVIDARDLARWVVSATERRVGGDFNAVDEPRTWEEVLDLVARVSGADTERIPVAEEWLVEQQPDFEEALPMWLPTARLDEALIADATRAGAQGLRCRPLEHTVRDVLADTHPDREGLERLTPEREAELLAAWGARS